MASFTDLKGLCKTCSVNECDIVNAFVLGSSGITGASTSSSDVDVVIVLKDDTNRKWKNQNWLVAHGWVGKNMLPKDGFKRDYSGSDEHDVWMYTQSTFKLMVERAVPFALECICLSNEAKWKNEVEYTLPSSSILIAQHFYIVSFQHLRRAGKEFATHHKDDFYNSGRIRIESWNLYKSKKSLFFSLRFLELAYQLIESKSIFDRESMLSMKQDLLNVTDDTWSSHMKVYEKYHSVLLKKLLGSIDNSSNVIDSASDIFYLGNPTYWCACEECSE